MYQMSTFIGGYFFENYHDLLWFAIGCGAVALLLVLYVDSWRK